MAVMRESPWYEQILQEGKQKGIQEVALNMLSKGMSAEEISDLTDLTVEQVQHLSSTISR
jgi:predicted transposase/invertase (TIGR01784 family)